MNGEIIQFVKVAYQSAYPEPLVVKAGEPLTVEDRTSEWPGWVWCANSDGKSGWMPGSYLQRNGEHAKALRDYDATELSVIAGDKLIVIESESGWCWCRTIAGRHGWVPSEYLQDQPLPVGED
jgi:uncharacterized protein YgiM (DUF1202 family)